MPFRVAFCGDSAMWGQGLTRQHTFAYLAATRIADSLGEALEVVPGRSPDPFEPLRGEARSGAKIRPEPDEDAAAFIDTFPGLFRSEQERLDLQAARDETPGSRLFGENPATFPTITDAVRHLAGGSGASVRLVLLNGGVNDIGFERVLDPHGPSMGDILEEIKEVFGDRLDQLLRDARAAFPQAVILVVGYFSVFSDRSNKDEIKQLLIYMVDNPFLTVLTGPARFALPPALVFLAWLGVGDAIRTAVRRSIHASAQAHFSTRQTIAALPTSVIGPGIVYAHPRFQAQHALFAGPQSLLHQGYRRPGASRSAVADEMLQTRLGRVPRLELLNDYRAIRSQIIVSNGRQPGRQILNDLRELLRAADLPVSLRTAARDIVDRQDMGMLGPLYEATSREIERIETAMIASFIHPNESGARRYANRIVSAFDDHRRYSIRRVLVSMRVRNQRGIHLGAAIKKHGFDPANGIRSLRRITPIESLGLLFEGRLSPGTGSTWLALGRVGMEFTVYWSGSNRLFLPFDVAMDLSEFIEVSLTPQGPPGQRGQGRLPRFDKLTVFFNAYEYMSLSRSEGRMVGEKLVLWAAR